MPRTAPALLALLFAASNAVAGDDKLFSGPQPGEKLTPFKVQGFSGPDSGKELRLPDPAGDAPTLLVFVHEITRPALQLLRPVDGYAATLTREGLQAHIVWLTADRAMAEQFLTRARGSLNLKTPVSISLDGLEGPGNYGLNRKMTLTILVAKDGKVTDNFAIIQPNETDAPKVLAALAKVTGNKVPVPAVARGEPGPRKPAARPAPVRGDPAREQQALGNEVAQLRRQVAILTEALNEARAKIAKLEGQPAPPPLPGPKTDAPQRPGPGKEGKPSANPELQGFMRRMIQKDNDEATVQRIADEMNRWAGTDQGRRAELTEYCRLVVRLRYGTSAAQQALKKLAGE
jgi:hypothetical protein